MKTLARLRPRSPGQAIVEFALVLPLLVAILFVIIEFGRLLQAWLTVQNAARWGLRFAVTGSYDASYCSAAAAALGLADADAYNGDPAGDCSVPDAYDSRTPPPGPGAPTARELSEMMVDWARMPSSRDQAQVGATGIYRDSAVAGDYIAYLTSHNMTYLGLSENVNYFHATLCSSRDLDLDGKGDFVVDPTTNPHTCLQTINNFLLDDAGGPGDRVKIIVTYEHEVIVPILGYIWPKVRLVAMREGIVEQFRKSRMSGITSQIGVKPTPTLPPTWTPEPTDTPEPTETPLPTDTPTNTATPTETTTVTPTATPTPSCEELTTGSNLYFDGNFIVAELANNSQIYPIELNHVDTSWNGGWHDEVDPLPSDQAFLQYYWGLEPLNPDPPDVSLSAGGVNFGNNINYTMETGESGELNEFFSGDFTNPNYSYNYFHSSDFNVGLDYRVGELECHLNLHGLYGPVVSPTPSRPVPAFTGAFSVAAYASDPDVGTANGAGINNVKFEVRDVTGVFVRGYTDPRMNPRYCLFGRTGGGNCRTQTVGSYWPAGSGMGEMITNGSFLVYIRGQDNDTHPQYTRIRVPITIAVPPTVTPTPTSTRTVTPTTTQTPTRTSTPTITQTPTITRTPTRTLTPTITLTPTRTSTPTITLTPTKTYTFTPAPPKPTNTPSRTPTATRTRTATGIPTITPTPTSPGQTPPTPTRTFTCAPPTWTRTPTITPTICRTPPDLGGCH